MSVRRSVKGGCPQCLNVSSQMKSVAAEERRIQQQIVAQQKKELTAFLENQKKEYRLCKDKIKEVNIKSESVMSRVVPVRHETQACTHSFLRALFLGDE